MSAAPDPDHLPAQLAERIAGGRFVVPPLPEVAERVIDLFNQPDPEPGALIALVGRDPVLAAHLLKTANSPLLRAATPATTVQQVVARLGMRMAGVTALAVCLGPQLFRAPRYSALIDRIWRHSQATAVWARAIALAGGRRGDTAFLAGLLHRIGEPVVLELIQQLDGSRGAGRSEAAIEALLADFGARAGIAVVAAWKLPDEIAEPIRHADDFLLAMRAHELVATVALARRLAALSPERLQLLGPAERDFPELAGLPLEDDDIAALLAQADEIGRQVDALAG